MLRSVTHYMSKMNWICTLCGMSSARRTSIQRHIDNANIHGGGARAIPFRDYSAGIAWGKYKVGRKPIFSSSELPFLLRLVNKIRLELENEIAKEVAKRISLKIDAAYYNNLELAARKHVWSKLSKETFGENL